MPGLSHLYHEGFGAANGYLLLVDRHRFPCPVVLRRSPVLVQVLQVEVLHVAGYVRYAPRVVRGCAEQDAGRERESDPSGLIARRRQMASRARRPAAARADGGRWPASAARCGPGTRNHPLVRSLCLGVGAASRTASIVASGAHRRALRRRPGRGHRQAGERLATASSPARRRIHVRRSSLSQLPDRPHAR